MNFAKLTAYLNDLEDTYGVPGLDIKILRDHKEIYRHRCGHRDFAKEIPVDGTELYDIYSASKVITMTAVMQLEEQGKLSLTDPVTKYLPVFANARVADDYTFVPYPQKMPRPDGPTHVPKNPIILADLMSMTAGLSYDIDNPIVRDLAAKTNLQADTMTMMEGIAGLPLLFEPGTRYCYSLGHDVMAAVVEAVSGERFADYLNKHIFAPLGITDMYMHPGDAERARMAAQWMVDPVTGIVRPEDSGNRYRLSHNYDSGGAGLTCSVDAYAAVADALACGGVGSNGGRILSAESIRKMSAPRLTEQQLKDFDRYEMGYSYALGMRTLVHKKIAKSPIGEFGWDGAAGAYCLMDPVNHISLFYAQEVLNMVPVYFEVHPKIRDLVYEGIFED